MPGADVENRSQINAPSRERNGNHHFIYIDQGLASSECFRSNAWGGDSGVSGASVVTLREPFFFS
jgi:hypothetical protein